MYKQEELLLKTKEIFNMFLDQSFSATSNVYFEKLISHLQSKENAFILEAPMAIEWVDKCLSIVCIDFSKVHPKVISFMLNLTSLLASNEWMIIRLRELKIMNRIIQFLKNEGHKFSPAIKLGGIRVMKAVTSYSMGLAFLRLEQAWMLLIEYSNKDHTLYVVREARSLLYEMLFKFCDKLHDNAVSQDIICEVLQPINNNLYQVSDDQIQIQVDDSQLLHKISSTLDLLTHILQKTLVCEERTNVVRMIKSHDFEVALWKLVDMTHNSYFMEKILTTLSSYYFALLLHEKLLNTDNSETPEEFTEFGLSFFNLMKYCINRNDGLNFIKLAELNHVLWKKLGNRAPKEILIENERVAFENQLICFHMLPLLFSMKASKKMADESKYEFFDNYIFKLLDISCQQTLRLCYSMRDIFFTPDGETSLLTPELANKCIHSILSLENILDREQAILVCQTLLYTLKEVVAVSENCHVNTDEIDFQSTSSGSNYFNIYPHGTDLVVRDPKFLHSVMVGLQTLIQRFKITWKESVETIGLVNCLAFMLENCTMDARCTVQALKLVQLAVEHFLSPNMALLVDNLQGSALVCLGPIIVKRMHNTAWEVRDTTLELTTSIACISRIKFPAFQQFLIDAKIPPIVYEMAKHDSEPYVRASAFKCLTKMVTINSLWEYGLYHLNLVEHLLFVLYRETEDVVRTEAIITLTQIYNHRKIPNKYKNTLFSTLNYCVVGDHHWEVKINALDFWKMEFQRQLHNQGMIDGIFPTVTFSKEHKKIVTLTEREVKLRIAKVFAEVQQYGYFGVILKCLREEYSIEVLKLIINGINAMYEKLNKHDIDVILADIDEISPDMVTGTMNCSSMPIIQELSHNAEESKTDIEQSAVIESILDTQDVNLLEKAFNSQMHLNHAPTQSRHIDEFYYKQFVISMREYNNEVKKFDLEKLVKQQQEWFECTDNLVSLLDDILSAIKRDEGMIADCY